MPTLLSRGPQPIEHPIIARGEGRMAYPSHRGGAPLVTHHGTGNRRQQRVNAKAAQRAYVAHKRGQ